MPIGFQGYNARFLLIRNWDQGWAEMRAIGFQSVDLVSFKGYGYEKSPLADMPARQIRQSLESVGMLCENCQFYYAELHQLAYLHKYPPRYFSMHAKDYLQGKTSVPVGQGVLNWKEIFKAAKNTAIENFFAEVAAYGAGSLHGVSANAWPTDSIDQLRQSYVYLHGLQI
jgi:hypothetical protein